MSEMVERVGEALRVKLIEWYAGGIDFEDGGLMLARAAIEAMREPTIKMASQGLKEWQCATDTGDLDTDAHDMELIWKAMIQAALGDG